MESPKIGSPLIPQRPKKIIQRSGRWEIIPDVEILRIQQLDPQTTAHKKAEEEFGPKVRILYSAKTYDYMVERREQLVASGVRPERIECVFAERDTIRAILDGRFEFIPLVAGDDV